VAALTESASRECAGCGADFECTDPRRRYCEDDCRNRHKQRRHKRKMREAVDQFDVFRDEVWRQLRRGVLDPEEALYLVVSSRPDLVAAVVSRKRVAA
jgi:hypothetical protein